MDKQSKRIQVLNYKKDYDELNTIFNQWDFLKIVSEGINNEYEDLIDPILKLLHTGSSTEELSGFISSEVTRKYGIEIKKSDKDVLETCGQIIKWWDKKSEL